MACAIINGDELDCRDSVGGISEIYMTEFTNKYTLTESSGVVTAHTLIGGARYWTFQVEKEDAELTENGQGSLENGTTFVEQTLTFSMKKWTPARRNKVKLLAQNRLLVIVKYKNGDYLMLGQTGGMDVTVYESKSGKAMGDMNGFNLTLVGKEPNLAPQVTSSLFPGLQSPA